MADEAKSRKQLDPNTDKSFDELAGKIQGETTAIIAALAKLSEVGLGADKKPVFPPVDEIGLAHLTATNLKVAFRAEMREFGAIIPSTGTAAAQIVGTLANARRSAQAALKHARHALELLEASQTTLAVQIQLYSETAGSMIDLKIARAEKAQKAAADRAAKLAKTRDAARAKAQAASGRKRPAAQANG